MSLTPIDKAALDLLTISNQKRWITERNSQMITLAKGLAYGIRTGRLSIKAEMALCAPKAIQTLVKRLEAINATWDGNDYYSGAIRATNKFYKAEMK